MLWSLFGCFPYAYIKTGNIKKFPFLKTEQVLEKFINIGFTDFLTIKCFFVIDFLNTFYIKNFS